MILLDLNAPEVTLQVFALNPDGSKKLDVVSAFVRVYHMVSGSEVVDLASTPLVQIGATNVWRYNWTPALLSVREYVVEYTMTDSGGFVFVGGEDAIVRDIAQQATLVLVKADVELIKKVETGRWKIVSNQMIFYDSDGTTPLLTFNLYDDGGLPSMENVFERRVP